MLPEPAAGEVHRALTFAVLDEAKAGKKSNKARNPNAQKVAAAQPFEDAWGYVFVVNAEKVILDHLADDPAQVPLFKASEKEAYEQANELRNLLGKLPALALHIDEVHHAATDDVKLRQVVSRWAQDRHVNTVLGYSGTPYLSSPETIPAGPDVKLRFGAITNTVYYYPLTEAIRTFLKKPQVKRGTGLEAAEIIRRGVQDFYGRYRDTVYHDGTRAKLAVYCGTIERLETEVRPLLLALGVPEDEVLAFHKGNKAYPQPPGSAQAFAALDRPESPYRVVLLVQIGKEGWDCRSLTSVVLSQAKDSPSNMVLQTSTRCLREVTREDRDASALIWLSDSNAKYLDKQLKEEQRTSIDELNALGKGAAQTVPVPRHDRSAHLRLPTVELVQLRVRHHGEVTAPAAPAAALPALVAALGARTRPYYHAASVQTSAAGTLSVDRAQADGLAAVEASGDAPAAFADWLLGLHRDGLGTPALATLRAHEGALRRVFGALTYEDLHGRRCFNDRFDRAAVERAVRLAFHARRTLRTEEETVLEEARLVQKPPAPVPPHDLLYPSVADVTRILDLDAQGDRLRRKIRSSPSCAPCSKPRASWTCLPSWRSVWPRPCRPRCRCAAATTRSTTCPTTSPSRPSSATRSRCCSRWRAAPTGPTCRSSSTASST